MKLSGRKKNRSCLEDGPICKAQTDLCHICKGKLILFFFRGMYGRGKERVQKSEEYQTTQIKREKRRRKMEQGATPSSSLRFISIKTEDRRCRNSNPDAGNCIHTHIQETSHLLSPLEPIQNKKPIFGDGNFIFFCFNFV